MKRRLAALMCYALIAFGQRGRPETPRPPLLPWVVDAVVVDASGRPVTDLAPEDFEVMQGGQARKITQFNWFDTRLHTSASPGGLEPALQLTPDDIRLNLVVIVDDLGLSSAGIDAVRKTLNTFLTDSMASGDRMAIVRSSGGSGVFQQLTGDGKVLTEAIQQIRYLGGSTGATLATRATWSALIFALQGLRENQRDNQLGNPGRSVVAVISESGLATPAGFGVEADAAKAAHAGGATVYAFHPLGTEGAPGFERLAHETGGVAGIDFGRMLQQERGYYAIGFQPNQDELSGAGVLERAPTHLKMRRPGLVVRSRLGFLTPSVPAASHAPLEQSVLLNRAMQSPFAGTGIGVRLTAGYSGTGAGDKVVDALVHFDSGSLVFIHDTQDKYRASAIIGLAFFTDGFISPAPHWRDLNLNLRPDEYRSATQYGLSFSFQVTLPRPGGWQVRALVADRGSDRMGSAYQYVDIPDTTRGGFAISGLRFGVSATGKGTATPLEDPAVRIFKPDCECLYQVTVFNPLVGSDKQSKLELQTRVLSGGKVAIEGTPGTVSFEAVPTETRRPISGKLLLNGRIPPGDYVLELTVRDLLAPPTAPRTMTRFIDFHVRL